jgi:hypothetical protein
MIMGFATLLVCALGAFGVVWVRQQIAATAQHTKVLEHRLAKTERKHQYLASRIAEVHQPSYLKGRVAGILDVPNEAYVVWADLPTNTRESGKNAAKAPFIEPLTLTLDLAFLATAVR